MAAQLRTTIGLKRATKDRLYINRAPGQCYDGFICQLVDLWEQIESERKDYRVGLVMKKQGTVARRSQFNVNLPFR